MTETSRLAGRVLVLAACITAMLAVPAFASGPKPLKNGVYEWSGSGDIQLYATSAHSVTFTNIACRGNFWSGNDTPARKAKLKNGHFVFHFHLEKTQKPAMIAGTFVSKKRIKLTGLCGNHIAKFASG